VTEISRKEMFDVLNDFYSKILEPRFDRMEKRLDGHDQKFDDLTRHLDQIYSRFERLEMEYHAINGAIDRLDEHIGKIEIQLKEMATGFNREVSTKELLEKEVALLKERISNLQNRVETIERELRTR